MTELDQNKNRRILVIDDNRAIHDDFRKILSADPRASAALDATESELFGQPVNARPKIRYEIDSAYQGQEGVMLVQQALAAGRPYAMAFVDVRMPPGMDGVETTRKIWAIDPDLQIVICTAYADYSWDEMFDKIGNSDGLVILKKPFDTVEALQLAQALTEKWWLHQQSRKKMEELEHLVAARTHELAKSLSLLNATLESTTDGIVVVDLSGQVVSYNTKFTDLWQFPAEMVSRRNAAEMRACSAEQVKNPTAFLQRIQELQARPETDAFDVMELKDGRTFERYVFPQRIDHECVGTVINWRDITARKLAEAELQWKTAFLEAQVSSSIDGILVVDQQGRKILQNQRVADLFKIPQSIAADQDDDKQFRWVAGMAKTPGPFAEKVAYLNSHPDEISRDEIELKDGTILDRYSAAVLGNAGKNYGRIWTFRDITERKRAEEQLRVQTSALEAAANGIVITDQDGKIQWVNPAFTTLTGYTAQEIVGQNPRILNSGKQAEAFYRNLWQTISSGRVWRGELTNRRKDGSHYFEEMTITPLKNAEGAIVRYIAIKQDITVRKGAEEVLRESEERFSGAFEYAPIGVALVAPDGRWLKVNRALCELVGYSEGELLSRTYQDITHPADLADCLDSVRLLFAGEIRTYQGEKRYVHQQGQVVPVSFSLSLVRDAQGQPLYLIAQIQDITKRRQAEAAVLESKRFLRSALDALSSHIAILDEHGTIIEVNAAWNRFATENHFLGGHGLGDNYLQVCNSASGNFSEEALAVVAGIRAVMSGQSDEFHLEYPCHSPREKRWFIVRATRFGGDGPVRVVVAHANITDRKLAENAMRESNEKFHQLADNITDVFWIRSPDLSEVQYISPAFERIWGRPAETLRTNPHAWMDFILPEDRERVRGGFAALMGDARSSDLEYRIVRPDGEIRWVRVRGFQVRDAADKLIRLAGIVTDITELKRVEEKLASERARFQFVFESMPVGAALSRQHPDGRIERIINDAHLRMCGLTREQDQLPGIYLKITHPEDAARQTELFRGLKDGGPGHMAMEKRYLRLDGQVVWVAFSFQRSADDDGSMEELTTVVDITERKRAETLVVQSEARYRSLIDNATDAIFTIGADGTFTSLNPAVEVIAGISRADWLGKPFMPMVDPDDLPLAREMFQLILKGERAPVHELRGHPSLRRPAIMEMTLTAQKDERGEIIGALGIGRDITERKRVERQLNIQNTLNRVLAESSTTEEATPKILQALCDGFGWDVSALWSVDARDTLLRCVEIWSEPNVPMDEFKAASRQMTFAPHVGLPGRVWSSGQPAWIADVIKDGNFPRASAANQAGLHAAFAFPILTGKEVSGVIEFFSRQVHEADPELLRTVVVVGSQLGQFFQRRHLENQLFQSQKLETVGKLAGGVAHEFNSILTAIIGQSGLLLEDLPVGSPLANNASEIIKAAGRAATLTRQLLAYGRKQFLRPEALNLNQVLASMDEVLGHLMGGDLVAVNLIPAAGLQLVKADVGQIEQVIMNMAMNARDAMLNGGKLTLETANVTFDPESVGRYPELKPSGYVVLAISDTGTGMSEEVKARVFEPFFSTKGVGEGAGLGLSTCYGIVKQSGGHISVYSEPGRGTTFKVYLPQVEPEAKLPVSRLDSPDLPRGAETILLVEDDPALREMAATLLRRLGYTVWTAANGVEALSVSHQPDTGHIDLLFTDVVMPHMSGNELADRVRALYPQTKILFTSAYTEQAIVHQGVLTKGVALLQKPFTPSALARRLRQVLDPPAVPQPGFPQPAGGEKIP